MDIVGELMSRILSLTILLAFVSLQTVHGNEEMVNTDYYVNLADSGISVIIENEGYKIIEDYNELITAEFSGKRYESIFNILTNGAKKQLQQRDYLSLITIGRVIAYAGNNCPCNTNWNNLLSYAIYVSLLRIDDPGIHDIIANYLSRFSCDSCLKPFSNVVKRDLNIQYTSYYYDLLVLCEMKNDERRELINKLIQSGKYSHLKQMSLDSIEKGIILENVKKTNRLEYRAFFGDGYAEKILLKRLDTATVFQEKIENAKLIGIAQTKAGINRLVQLLNDTTTFETSTGVILSLRGEIFEILREVFSDYDLFTRDYIAAKKEDWKESQEGRIVVNKYFNEVADWVKSEYGYDLKHLRKADFLKKGHHIIIDVW